MEFTEGRIVQRRVKDNPNQNSFADFITEFSACLCDTDSRCIPIRNGIILCAEGRMFKSSLALMNAMVLTIEKDASGKDAHIDFRAISGGGILVKPTKPSTETLHQLYRIRKQAQQDFHFEILVRLINLADHRCKELSFHGAMVEVSKHNDTAIDFQFLAAQENSLPPSPFTGDRNNRASA